MEPSSSELLELMFSTSHQRLEIKLLNSTRSSLASIETKETCDEYIASISTDLPCNALCGHILSQKGP